MSAPGKPRKEDKDSQPVSQFHGRQTKWKVGILEYWIRDILAGERFIVFSSLPIQSRTRTRLHDLVAQHVCRQLHWIDARFIQSTGPVQMGSSDSSG